MSRSPFSSNSSGSGSSGRVAIAEEEDVEIEDSSPPNEEDSSGGQPGHSRERSDSTSSWSSGVEEFPIVDEEDLNEAYENAPRDEQGIPEAIIRPVRPVIGPRSRVGKCTRGRAPFEIPSCTGIQYSYQPKKKPLLREQTSTEACKLMVDYLISEGYKDVAETLCKEAGLELPVRELRELDGRVAIREAIITGNLKEAIRLIHEICPGLMESNSEIRFNLHQQNMIEMIRIQAIDEVLTYAEKHISNDEELNPDQLERLERTFALLAFDDPKDSPFSDALSMDHRQTICTEVNSAVLLYQDRPSTPRLEALIRMITWGQHQLLEKDGRVMPLNTVQLSSALFAEYYPDDRDSEFGTSI